MLYVIVTIFLSFFFLSKFDEINEDLDINFKEIHNKIVTLLGSAQIGHGIFLIVVKVIGAYSQGRLDNSSRGHIV